MCGRRQQARNIHHAELLVRLYSLCLPSFKQRHPAIGLVFEVVDSFILGELNEKKIAPDELHLLDLFSVVLQNALPSAE